MTHEEFICISFDYSKPRHKEFIDRIEKEARALGCATACAHWND